MSRLVIANNYKSTLSGSIAKRLVSLETTLQIYNWQITTRLRPSSLAL